MKEAGIKTIAGTHGIYNLDGGRAAAKLTAALARHGAFRAGLDDHRVYMAGEFSKGLIKAAGPSGFHRLVRVQEKDVHGAERPLQAAIPSVFGIVVRVERGCQPGSLHPLEDLRDAREQRPVEIKRRNVKVARIGEVVEIAHVSGLLAHSTTVALAMLKDCGTFGAAL